MELGWFDRILKIGIMLNQKEKIYNRLLEQGVWDYQLQREMYILKDMLHYEVSLLSTQP